MRVFRAPKGPGLYGITVTPSGDVYYASLAGSYVGRVEIARTAVRVLEPPTRGQGARRAWSDSKGRIWVSEECGKGGRLCTGDAPMARVASPGDRADAVRRLR